MFNSATQNSSTEKRKTRRAIMLSHTAMKAQQRSVSSEPCLLTGAYQSLGAMGGFQCPVEASRERIKTVRQVNALVLNSNGKDKRKAEGLPLLNHANSSRMLRFADQQRDHNVAADEVVMDRGAESTAGGFDVI